MKLKACNPEENKYYLMFNNVLPSDSDLLRTNTHKGCCMLNANEYNYEPRSVIGQKDESKVKNGRGSINRYVTRSYVHG